MNDDLKPLRDFTQATVMDAAVVGGVFLALSAGVIGAGLGVAGYLVWMVETFFERLS